MLKLLRQATANVKTFTPFMLQTAECLSTNKQGGPLVQLAVSSENPMEYHVCGSIVVHTLATLSANPKSSILLPFLHMLTNPAVLAVSIPCIHKHR